MKATVLLAAALALATGTVAADTSMQRIMDALEEGRLDAESASELLVLSVTDPSALPGEYVEGTEPAPSGTPAMLQAYRLNPDMRANRPNLSGPEYTLTSPDGHFLVHWTDQGADATNQSYAEGIAEAADYSWQVECDEMGFFEPPPDAGVGGNDLYDIYIMNIGPLGYTSGAGEFQPPDSTHDCSASHIVMCRGLQTGQRNCTVSHEFAHAIQMSYDYNEPIWFMENCAVWAEEQVYPEVNDYVNYLHGGDNPLRKPWWDIRDSGGSLYHYGGVLWAMYMSQRLDDTDVIRQVWQYCADTRGMNMMEAQEDMFADHGMLWEDAFMEYGLWRWFTAGNWFSGCGLYFDEAPLWTPGPYVFSYHQISSLPATGDEGVYFPERFGIAWIQVDLTDYQDGWVKMDFDGRDYFEWNLGAIMWDEGEDWQFAWYDCDGTTGDKTVSVDASGWDYVVFFPAFISESSLDHTYDFEITYESGAPGGETPRDISVAPASNPARPGTELSFSVPAACRATLLVYDASGRVVDSLFDGEVAAGSHSVSWEAEGLSTGSYFLTLHAGNAATGTRVVLTR